MSLNYRINKKASDGKKLEGSKEDVEAQADFYSSTEKNFSLCFIETSGRKTSLNYSYLLSIEFDPEPQKIILEFSSVTVTVKGNNLEELFVNLERHSVRSITSIEKRYITTINPKEVAVTEIEFQRSNLT
jgi:hypothetical protein